VGIQVTFIFPVWTCSRGQCWHIKICTKLRWLGVHIHEADSLVIITENLGVMAELNPKEMAPPNQLGSIVDAVIIV
jgi:hypothetical protein